MWLSHKSVEVLRSHLVVHLIGGQTAAGLFPAFIINAVLQKAMLGGETASYQLLSERAMNIRQ